MKLMKQQSIARRDLPTKLRYYVKALHFCIVHRFENVTAV
jgi:hypothetical protein